LLAHRPRLACVSDEELSAIVAAARRAWPALDIEAAAFVLHLAQRIPADAESLTELHTADLYLACGCALGDPRAIHAFDLSQLSHVDGAVARVSGARDFIDEVRQRLRERLLVGSPPRIASYSGKGALTAWVRIAATRLALNLARESHPGDEHDALGELRGGADPERDAIVREHRSVVELAFRAAFAGLDADARRLLRLHYVKGVSLEEIGRRRRVDRSTASRRLAAVREQLLAETRRELEARIPTLTASSRDSLLQALRTRLDFSLESILGS
jgi:RNA polymerase sigma-70 factor (ECF subfamily)